jgi:hypothetical protein
MSDAQLIDAWSELMREDAGMVAAAAAPAPARAEAVPLRMHSGSRLERPDRMRDLSRDLAAACAADPERAPWPEDWCRINDPMDAARCLALWQEALVECIAEALLARRWELNGRTGPRRRAMTDTAAVSWSWIGSHKFHEVCALAGFDGAVIAEGVLAQCHSPAAIDRLLAELWRGPTKRGRRKGARA